MKWDLVYASEKKDVFFDLIGNEVTFNNTIITHGGKILYNKGDKVKIIDVQYRTGFWSDFHNCYVEPELHGFKLENSFGIYYNESFKEFS